MARIVYGVMGDSRGHMSRSLAVARELAGHEILFMGGGVIPELRDQGFAVEEIPMLGTMVRDGAVDSLGTVTNALSIFARRPSRVRRVADAMRAFGPDLVISDYEYFTPLAARVLDVPCVSLDHSHVLTHCRYQAPPGEFFSRLYAVEFCKRLFSKASRFLVTSFFQLEPKDERTEVFPPILRQQVREVEASQGEHGLVYLRGRDISFIRAMFGGRKRRFLVYGLGEQPDEGNLSFRPRSNSGFLRDLAGSAYVAASAGHNTLSEALHFGKPVLAFPTAMFYEQYINAWFLAERSMGMFSLDRRPEPALLDRFEQRLDRMRAAIAGTSMDGNALVAKRLEQLLGGRG